MLMYAEALELRGVEKKVSQKTSQPYLVFHMEESSGNPMSFVCRNMEVYKDTMKKGDLFTAVFDYTRYGKVERLNLIGLEREANV